MHKFDKNSTPNTTKSVPKVKKAPIKPNPIAPVLRKPTKQTTPDSVKSTELATPVLRKPTKQTTPDSVKPTELTNEMQDEEALNEFFNAYFSTPATTDTVTTAPLNKAPLLSYPNPFIRVQEPVEPKL